MPAHDIPAERINQVQQHVDWSKLTPEAIQKAERTIAKLRARAKKLEAQCACGSQRVAD